MNELLIIFLRNPILSKVKTRLAATIGDAAALAVYLHLLQHTRTITDSLHVRKFIYYSDYIDTEDNWSNVIYQKALQRGKDLGEKMKEAFANGFEAGFDRVCIIGTDCEEISSDIIRTAFERLNDHDIVIGPAKDGGYYLLGMRKLHPDLFRNKQWSSDQVAASTLQDCSRLGLEVFHLPVLSDVDIYEDLSEKLKSKI